MLPKPCTHSLSMLQAIEEQYKEILEKRCYAERVQQQQTARWGQREKARGMQLPHCNEIYERFGYRYNSHIF